MISVEPRLDRLILNTVCVVYTVISGSALTLYQMLKLLTDSPVPSSEYFVPAVIEVGIGIVSVSIGG